MITEAKRYFNEEINFIEKDIQKFIELLRSVDSISNNSLDKPVEHMNELISSLKDAVNV